MTRKTKLRGKLTLVEAKGSFPTTDQMNTQSYVRQVCKQKNLVPSKFITGNKEFTA